VPAPWLVAEHRHIHPLYHLEPAALGQADFRLNRNGTATRMSRGSSARERRCGGGAEPLLDLLEGDIAHDDVAGAIVDAKCEERMSLDRDGGHVGVELLALLVENAVLREERNP
jgi:hypothetical protein